MSAGDELHKEIVQAIEQSDYLIAVISNRTLGSRWVKKEIKLAQECNIKVIPVLLDGLDYEYIEHLFSAEPLCLTATENLDQLMVALLPAIGLASPTDITPPIAITQQPIDELVLSLTFDKFIAADDEQRVSARATIFVHWADNQEPSRSNEFMFTAPFGKKAIDDIRWYIETYYQWPSGVFKQRAQEIEANLTTWGQALFAAIFAFDSTKARFNEWWNKDNGRKFSVEVITAPPEGSDEDTINQCNRGSTELLALPWEIICSDAGFWFDGANKVAIRRRLPKYGSERAITASLPIRVLLLNPRPLIDDNGEAVGYIDHRTSAKALFDAMESLGEHAIEVTLLNPPTFAKLKQTLTKAKTDEKPFHVVHFDGHGVYDTQVGLGALCFEKGFEQPQTKALQPRILELVHADTLAKQMQHFGVPLFYLDACQSATMQTDPKASVATRLLESGVGAVVAMSYSVLVATAKCFVEPFYHALAEGKTVGEAILSGQQKLFDVPYRFDVMGAGKLKLQDWLVPVLYQELHDSRLFNLLPSEQAKSKIATAKQSHLNDLPKPPKHQFVGRSRELLAFERLLEQYQQLVIKAGGGFGKTATAVELCRWLTRIGVFERVVFVDIEHSYLNASAADNFNVILQVIGRQLVPNYSAVQYSNSDKALQPILRALDDHKVIMLFDNMETILPDSQGNQIADIDKLLGLCSDLLAHNNNTRMIFTSRETLPAPFDAGAYNCELGELHPTEAIELVEKVMANHGWLPPENDDATTPTEIKQLVEAVNCHPRALELLAREVARERQGESTASFNKQGGVKQTTINIQQLMGKLHQQNPNDRENSLYASVELSLHRLPVEIRQNLSPLQVLHGGGQLGILAGVMRVDNDGVKKIVHSLIEVGLAIHVDHGYIRLDPALSHYVSLTVDEKLGEHKQRWQQAVRGLVMYLYEEYFENTAKAMQLCTLELPNIIALVAEFSYQLSSKLNHPTEDITIEWLEQVSDITGSSEFLIEKLGNKPFLAQVKVLREQAAQLLTEQLTATGGSWSSSQFNNASAEIESLMASGDMAIAIDKAQTLLQQCLNAGIKAYDLAGFDIAMAYFLLGRLFKRVGQTEQALLLLSEAQQRFNDFAASNQLAVHRESVQRMTSVCTAEQADCLVDLGQYQEAIERYKLASEQDEKRGDNRQQGAVLTQMATAYLMAEQYDNALDGYQQAKSIFEQIQEPQSLAATYHQIGWLYDEIEQYTLAEKNYRLSLDINTQINDVAGQAASLNMLGGLYKQKLNKPLQALDFCYQALDRYKLLDDRQQLGTIHNNIANTLLELGRYSEAKTAINSAIEYRLPFGVVATPWQSYDILMQITLKQNLPQAREHAYQAWLKARDWYLKYRRQRGEPQHDSGKLADDIFQLLTAGEDSEGAQQAIELLQQIIADEEYPQWLMVLAKQLLLIVNGERDIALGDNDELSYSSAAELIWLIERLNDA